MWHRGVFLTDEVIQEKGRRLQSSLNLFNSPEEQTHIRFSNGWIDAETRRSKRQQQKTTQPNIYIQECAQWLIRVSKTIARIGFAISEITTSTSNNKIEKLKRSV